MGNVRPNRLLPDSMAEGIDRLLGIRTRTRIDHIRFPFIEMNDERERESASAPTETAMSE